MENKEYKLYLGSHVSMSAPDYFLGSVKEALSFGENALMIYTGAPQNTLRKPISQFKVDEAKTLLKENNIPLERVIVHAPYIINLCSEKPETRQLAVDFLIQELKRCDELSVKYVVLHPGSRLKQPEHVGLEQVAQGLNFVFKEYPTDVVICLETMAGKGSEVGISLEQLSEMINMIDSKKNVGVCVDTCHINDAGYDLSKFDEYLNDFDKLIGLDKLKVVHLNDSKNTVGAHKDRHENIGYGYVGFENILNVVYHPKLDGIVKVLETPYVTIDLPDGKKDALPPYKYEIQMIKDKKWFDFKSEIIKKASE